MTPRSCKKFPFNNGGWLLAAAAISTIGSYETQQSSMRQQEKEQAHLEDVNRQNAAQVSPDKAEQAAKDAQSNERRMLLASGGQTNITGGNAPILGDDIKTINMAGV